MKDGLPSQQREPERRSGPRRGKSARRSRGFVERATSRGHSGIGSASMLPLLRDQLKLKSLLPTPYPIPEPEHPGKDELKQ
jgi:hypothetical protein